MLFLHQAVPVEIGDIVPVFQLRERGDGRCLLLAHVRRAGLVPGNQHALVDAVQRAEECLCGLALVTL